MSLRHPVNFHFFAWTAGFLEAMLCPLRVRGGTFLSCYPAGLTGAQIPPPPLPIHPSSSSMTWEVRTGDPD